MKRSLCVLALALLLTSCGKHYWEAQDSTRGLSAFIEDSRNCAGEAKTAKYGVGTEEMYRACMKAHGWRRVQTPDPTNAQFRGPEDVDEFAYPPPPLSERGAGPRRAGDPTCVGPTATRPSHCR